MKRLVFSLTLSVVLTVSSALAQQPPATGACGEPDVQVCDPLLNLVSGQFQATPFVDAQKVNGMWPDYGDPDHNVVSLYGIYGNNENDPLNPQAAKDHYQKGIDLAAMIQPLCTDGSVPPPNTNCTIGGVTQPPAIVFLFLGFSNCDLEICGGNLDAWDALRPGHLAGQPCATQCPNKNNPDFSTAWNQVRNKGWDGIYQQSFIYQVYNSNPSLVGSHVVIWDGALGSQNFSKWDPTPMGWYASNDCFSHGPDPECNYHRIRTDLRYNNYSENQVQAIFIKSSDSFPTCDLKKLYCVDANGNPFPSGLPDAYQSEIYLGDILRYLKCCALDSSGNSTGLPRYAHLQQVFLTSRIYGGYANGSAHGCLMPEPFSYEEGFAIQRMIVSQIDQANGGGPEQYAQTLSYNVAPWFDWGPYLWASGDTPRLFDQLAWCNAQNDSQCHSGADRDVRYGDTTDQTDYWGDFTHPTAGGIQKVANQLVTFIGKTQGKQGSPWVMPWIGR